MPLDATLNIVYRYNMQIENVALFCAIAQLGTLSAAARKLDIAPMAASRRLASLERDVRARLVHRTTRSLALTVEGEAFLPHAIELLEAHEAALSAIAAGTEDLQGVLKVTAPNVIGRSVVVPILARLMRDNPALRVDLTLTDGIVDIAGAGLDLAIRVSPLDSSDLIATQISPNPRILCASPDFIKKSGMPGALDEVLDKACLTLHDMPEWPFQLGDRLQWIRVPSRFAANSVEALRSACIEGAGIAMMTYWDVRDSIECGDLLRIDLRDASLGELGIWAIYPSRKHLPQRTRAVIDALRSRLTCG